MDYVIINVTGGKAEIENVQGKSYIANDKAGGVIWKDAGEKHELRNLTDQPYRNILVELKAREITAPAPAGSVLGFQYHGHV